MKKETKKIISTAAVMMLVNPFSAYATSAQCRQDCRSSFSACLSQIGSTDPDKQAERRTECESRNAQCMASCGDDGTSIMPLTGSDKLAQIEMKSLGGKTKKSN